MSPIIITLNIEDYIYETHLIKKRYRDKYIKSDYNKLEINSRLDDMSCYGSEDEGG